MKLLTLKIEPQTPQGWESDQLEFADCITQLYGPNSSGKTPVIQSFIYCLGYPVEFRDDIYIYCKSATLKVLISDKIYTFKRFYSKNHFEVIVNDPIGNEQTFLREGELSEYLFELLNIEYANLVDRNNKITSPFISTILPVFYLSQENGYHDFYSAKSNFIKDQYSEMIRLLLDLPLKNSFNKRRHEIRTRERRDHLDKVVHQKKQEFEIANERVQKETRDIQIIDQEIDDYLNKLKDLKDSRSIKTRSLDALDDIISGNKRKIENLDDQIKEIKYRNSSIDSIKKEIENEIATLGLNEESKRIFQSFEEICASAECNLFKVSSESYGKNLLYLKDQLKDLDRNAKTGEIKIDALKNQMDGLADNNKNLESNREKLLENDELNALIEAISELTKKIYELELEKKEAESLDVFEKDYVEAMTRRDEVQAELESFSVSRGQSIPDIVKFRLKLKENFIKWLDIINTSNVSRDIDFINDFIPIMGKEKKKQIGGSTGLRVVLAYHVALIETFCKIGKNKINFLIFDTPRQHDISEEDLDAFIKEVKKLAAAENLQIIFSTTDYHYQGDDQDRDWIPRHDGVKHNMFLNHIGAGGE